VHTLLTALAGLPAGLVYVVAALLIAAETGLMLGLVLPGEATLLLVGFLSYRGTLSLLPAIAVMVVAGVAGDALAFRGGLRGGPRVRASRLGRWVGDERWERADSMVTRLGGRAFFGSRWVAFVRTLAPRLAGGSGMRYRVFAPWSALGVLTWVVASVLLGYVAGDSYARVSELLGQATGAVLGLLVLLVAIALVGRWLGRNPDPVKALISRIGRVPAVGRLVRWADSGYRRLLGRLGAGWTLVLNLVAGTALLFGIGAALAALSSLVVTYSGLTQVDGAMTRWIAAHTAPGVTHAAQDSLSIARGPVLIAIVAVVATVMGFRTRRWHGDLVTVLGTAGAFLPLIVLTFIAREAAPDAGITARFLTTQAAVGTASICTLAWLLTRQLKWGWAVTVWTMAAALIALLGGARLYVGADTVSSLASAVLLGALWALMFMVAWAGAGAASRPAPERTLLGPPAVHDPGREPTSGATAPAADPGGADPGGVDPGGADPGGADPGGADPDGADPGGADPGGADPAAPPRSAGLSRRGRRGAAGDRRAVPAEGEAVQPGYRVDAGG
jgi:undecaprenyl-diphosphatase